MCQKLPLCIIFFFIVFISGLNAQEGSIVKRAGDAFNNDELEQAKSLYLNAVGTDPANPDIYINLGYIYEEQKNYATAISYYQKGLPYAGARKGMLYVNIGNVYFKLGDYASAEKMYTSAISEVPPVYKGYLHRANARVQIGTYADAISDYQTYLSVVPDTPQRQSIESMILALKDKIDEAEAKRLAEEAKRLEEEERQRKLLESVLNSLDEASADTKNLSAGTEGVETPEIELDIVE